MLTYFKAVNQKSTFIKQLCATWVVLKSFRLRLWKQLGAGKASWKWVALRKLQNRASAIAFMKIAEAINAQCSAESYSDKEIYWR